MEGVAPLHWLETSFEELCRRVVQRLHAELRHEKNSAHERDGAQVEEEEAGVRREKHEQRLAAVCEAVREQATCLISALEGAAKSVGSRPFFMLRRQWQRSSAAAGASEADTRKRKSNRSATAAPADTMVRDTLLNTVERVGLEVHLVHVWLSRLCEEGSFRVDAAPGNDRGGAPCVEAVLRQALGWSDDSAAAAAFPSVAQLQWMLATALLERVHVQSYHFHHSQLSKAAQLKGAANADSARPTYVVKAAHLPGLAALVDFALAEHDAEKKDPPLHGEMTSPFPLLDESLFILLAAFHAVLPTYAVLLPAWQRALAVSSTEPHHQATPARRGIPIQLSQLEADDGSRVTATGTYRSNDRDAILAASPTAVWDVVAERWALQEEAVRQEGGLAAVWWLRLLPLWINTATCTLQLRVVADVLTSNAQDATRAVGDDDAAMRVTSDAEDDAAADDGACDVHRLTANDVAASLDALLTKSADLLRYTLRFDGVRYERSRSTPRAADLQSRHDRNPPNSSGVATNGEDGEMGNNTIITDAEGNVRRGGENGGGVDDNAGADGGLLSGADTLPPLQRNRGKRSLFYKPHDGEENSILHAHGDATSNSSDSRRMRFVSRVRSNAGHVNNSAASSTSHHRSPGHLSAASAEAHARTGALFDVLVLSAETPILLAHRFGLTRAHHRSTALEDSWAAAAQAKSELWRLLYALPSAAAAAAAATRNRDGTWGAAPVLRSVLPAAVLSLLPATVASPAVIPAPGDSATSPKHKKTEKKTAQTGAAANDRDAERDANTLRRVLCVLERAQRLLGLVIFEAVEHLLVALAEVLLRIQHTGQSLVPQARHGALDETTPATRVVDHDTQRATVQLAAVITIGATTLLADNPLSWESMNAAWQLRQLRGGVSAKTLGKSKCAGLQQQRIQPAAVASSAAMHAFSVQWTSVLTKETPFLALRSRQNPSAALANAREILKVLQTTSTAAAALPLYAKQVSAAVLLQSLTALANYWRGSRDVRVSNAAAATPPHSRNVMHQELLEVYQGLLDVLTADADLRLLCCYAAFVEGLYEVHLRLKADHAALIAWADKHLLPLVLPVVVAGLRRSQASHNAATHADLCETTLVLLSPLSRYAANPDVSLADVLRTHWNQVLLHVSLYCIRMAGRGGAKRASSYGMPPVVLPRLTEATHSSLSLAPTATRCSAAFAHGAEPVFLRLLDHSNGIMHGARSIAPRDVDAADGMRAALAAYVAAWDTQVRFGRHDWDAMVAATSEDFTFSPARNGATSVPTTHALLTRLQASCAAVQTFSGAMLPARAAGAEATPFLASKPVKAHQLGYLVRFMEHYLREQERLSRLSNAEMHALTTTTATSTASPTKAQSSSTSAAPATARASLGDTAPLVMLDFVGHLSSAGAWSMVIWACNIAEIVVKIELTRNRLIPEAARAVAATAILSQIRVIPPARRSSVRLPVSLIKSLVSMSDVMGSTVTSLLGFNRRSVLQGLLCHPTRDQYRVLTFGLKQATAYVQIDSRKFRAWQDRTASVSLQTATPVAAADIEHAGNSLGGESNETDGQTSGSGDDAATSTMIRKVGRYYAQIWSEHVSAQKASQPRQPEHGAGGLLVAVNDDNGDFRNHMSCLVCLTDACMEAAQLYLLRQQGDGEEEIRLVIEAAVMELCRGLAACTQSVISLTREQLQTCFSREAAELLWTSLCVTATISTVAPRDAKDHFFTPRCAQAVQRLFHLTEQLIEVLVGQRTPIAHDREAVEDAEGAAEEEPTETPPASGAASEDPSTLLSARPLCTALVQGAQLLLRDPRCSQRLAIRIAMRGRDRDDLTAMLTAFHVLLTSARFYAPGRSLLSVVWARLALELTQPLPVSVTAAGPKLSEEEKAKSVSAGTVLMAATVPSSREYSAILRDLAATGAEMNAAAMSASASADAAGEAKSLRKTAAYDVLATARTGVVPICDLPTALACVVEDAAAIQHERRRSLQGAAARAGKRSGEEEDGAQMSYGLWGKDFSAATASSITQPHLSIAAALENGTVPLSEVIDAAIMHAVATVRAAGDRSSFDVAAVGEGDDNPEAAIGFQRLIREYCQDMMDLLLHVPLRDLLRHPQVETLFSCLNLLQGSVRPETEAALWRQLSAKWRKELLEPCEKTFLTLQQSQLALVRACRGLADVGDGAGTGGSMSAPPPDVLARVGVPASAAAFSAEKSMAATSVSAAAHQSMRDHWHPAMHNLSHHDDGRRLVSSSHFSRERSHNRKAKGTTDGAAPPHEAFPGELDREATGLAALAAMPDPVPVPVLLSILKSLHRKRNDVTLSSAPARRGRTSGLHPNEHAAWLVEGGGSGSSGDGISQNAAALTEFVEVVLTYTARTFWLLRPRLDDNAWLAWATVERSMAVYPAENGVRQQAWERVCRQWRLPTSLEHATVVAGQLFSSTERRRISAWMAAMGEVCPAVAVGSEEVAVYRYLRSTALYLQLLTVSMALLVKHRMLGDLPYASPDVVRRRLQTQLQRRNNSGRNGQDESTARALVQDALRQELKRLAQDRQTQQDGVNRNVFEGAALQYLNVSWCITRHADSLTHMATDVIIAQLTDAPIVSSGAAAAASSASPSALISYADDVRFMVTGVLQETLDTFLCVHERLPMPLSAYVTQTLLTSGFSCDPLYLRQPYPDRTSQAKGGTLSAASVVAALVNASDNASTVGSSGSGAAAAASTAMSSAASVLSPVSRVELFVGSPTMLAVLTPHFIKRTVMIGLQDSTSAAELLPVTSALESYLSRRNVPLSPLLEATTELLTSSPVRSSAVHTYCERLAGALTKRKEFRQALAPPTIASVEQGAAGSISNEVVISFVAAIARQDVHVTKKTLAHLLHAVMTMRLDVFGQPPTANRQGKLTLVQVGTTVEATIDTTNPLYAPTRHAHAAAKEGVAGDRGSEKRASDSLGDDAAAVMAAFSADKWADFTAMTHRKALADLTIPLPTIVEVAMHMEAMRPLEFAERRRATQMLKAADDARRERVAMHRSQAQVAATAAVQGRAVKEEDDSETEANAGRKAKATRAEVAQVGKLDASLHLEDPRDFGVIMLHLRYALRKVVHASLRRLLHQQGPRMLAEVATMLEMVDSGMRSNAMNAKGGTPHRIHSSGGGESTASFGADDRPLLYDGVLAGTTRVLLSRAVLCAQAIGYDANGAPIELPPLSSHRAAADTAEPLERQSVLKLPVPALQASAVEAAISALGTGKGRHAPVGHSSGKIGQLTKEEKAAVYQRVELEREAAVTVGLSTLGVPWRSQQRISRALRYTRRQLQLRKQRNAYNRRRYAQRTSSALASPSPPFAATAGAAA
ncbi:putative mitochondrial hypothetical protein [Leptomonas pyrrhocoris]|uniref:Uncharacterized protein n=1 Tax=Leptomonas pyrrhocoris TaxID=157538 RepID=A0A0M9FXK8_LEPPY|nr:putative mitochondrial hypothetical protein [Leptomonas pyrrhocoris]KPA78033.1 putative mitochondrial hypothetical protein [Leptomonas pyrrhocoris]|eukprot:XP_015656472.1 putative mitochondrial hypothetical protein [Leptomonas pyrrhocoris]